MIVVKLCVVGSHTCRFPGTLVLVSTLGSSVQMLSLLEWAFSHYFLYLLEPLALFFFSIDLASILWQFCSGGIVLNTTTRCLERWLRWTRTFVILAEDLGSVPSTHVVAHSLLQLKFHRENTLTQEKK